MSVGPTPDYLLGLMLCHEHTEYSLASESLFVGYFATSALLPADTPEDPRTAGEFAVVGDTDTIWVWNVDADQNLGAAFNISGTTVVFADYIHGMATGDEITIANSSNPTELPNGTYEITVVAEDQFTIVGPGAGDVSGTADWTRTAGDWVNTNNNPTLFWQRDAGTGILSPTIPGDHINIAALPENGTWAVGNLTIDNEFTVAIAGDFNMNTDRDEIVRIFRAGTLTDAFSYDSTSDAILGDFIRINDTVVSIGLETDLPAAAANVLIGYDVGNFAIGSENTLIGWAAGNRLSGTSAGNVGIGSQALYAAASSSAKQNTAVGAYTLHAATTAQQNVAIGFHAAENATDNQGSVCVGYYAGNSNTGNYNVFVGYQAGVGLDTSGSICVGQYAGLHQTAGDVLIIDNQLRQDGVDNELYEKENSMIYGEFNADRALQNLFFGANVTVREALTVTDILTANATQITAHKNVIPGSNEAYDLGSAAARWRDLYLAGGTIYLYDGATPHTLGIDAGDDLAYDAAKLATQAFASNADNITSGNLDDARLPDGIVVWNTDNLTLNATSNIQIQAAANILLSNGVSGAAQISSDNIIFNTGGADRDFSIKQPTSVGASSTFQYSYSIDQMRFRVTTFDIRGGDNDHNPLRISQTAKTIIFDGERDAYTLAIRRPTTGDAFAYNGTDDRLEGDFIYADTSRNISLGRLATKTYTGTGNLYVGEDAGRLHNGQNSIFIGQQSGYNITGGSANFGIGRLALYSLTSSYNHNIAFGEAAGYRLVGGSWNYMMGFNAGYGTNSWYGNFNSCLGAYSLNRLNSGGTDFNVLNNVAVGSYAGQRLLRGEGNTFIGHGAGYSDNTDIEGSYNICIGHRAGQYESNDHRLFIDSLTRYNSSRANSNAIIRGIIDYDRAVQSVVVNANFSVTKANPTGAYQSVTNEVGAGFMRVYAAGHTVENGDTVSLKGGVYQGSGGGGPYTASGVVAGVSFDVNKSFWQDDSGTWEIHDDVAAIGYDSATDTLTAAAATVNLFGTDLTAITGAGSTLVTQAYVDAAVQSKDTFLELNDVVGTYATAGALFATNGTPDGLYETTVLLTEPAANQFQIARGSSALLVQGDLTVEGDSAINQDVTSDGSPTFAASTITTTLTLFGGTPFTSLATGAADNAALPTQGYVDDLVADVNVVNVDLGIGTHGFTDVLTVIYNNAGTWTKAQADDPDTLGICVVSKVVDANEFEYKTVGIVTDAGHGLTVGQYYYLSATTPGALSIDPPVAEGQFSNPIVYVLDANRVFVFPWRPVESLARLKTSITPVDTTTYNVLELDEMINVDAAAAGGPVTVNLLAPAAKYAGYEFTVKKIDAGANAVTVKCATGTIDGVAGTTGKIISAQWDSITFVCDGSNYYIK